MADTKTILQELRAAGLTQVQIAERTGIPQPRLSKWEKNGSPKSVLDAFRLADLHRVIVGKRRKANA